MVEQWDRKFPTLFQTSPFKMLEEELHVNDRLRDIRFIATHLFNKFSDLHFLSQGITFDRSLMKSTWTLTYAVSPLKCAGFIINIYKICEADNGHQHSFRIYIRENRIANTTIVLIMFKSLYHKGHTLFTDNWYNSPRICRIFVTRGINVWGMTLFCLKIWRRWPSDLILKKHPLFEIKRYKRCPPSLYQKQEKQLNTHTGRVSETA